VLACRSRYKASAVHETSVVPLDVEVDSLPRKTAPAKRFADQVAQPERTCALRVIGCAYCGLDVLAAADDAVGDGKLQRREVVPALKRPISKQQTWFETGRIWTEVFLSLLVRCQLDAIRCVAEPARRDMDLDSGRR
jgi:hypothetical protein